MGSAHVAVTVDLARIHAQLAEIRTRTKVRVYAVVKADAYGLGAAAVARAVADVVDGFCVFDLAEALAADLATTGKPTLVLGPPTSLDAALYRRHLIRPAVATREQAETLREAAPTLCIDTGMQRFGCPRERVAEVLATDAISEVWTHGTRLEHVDTLLAATSAHRGPRHAAASALLAEPRSWLDAVRPGIAAYRGAVTATTALVECHRSSGPVGYGGFAAERHGVILCGYAHGLRPGPCSINGRPQRILEVGMQSAYVSIDQADTIGDGVRLLGGGIAEDSVAGAWRCSAHEVILRMSGMGERRYLQPR
jgi:alanine racemase